MINYDTQDLQYLQMMQENITRMAGNSANAKTWLITIVTGFFAIGCSINDLDWWLLLAIIPIIVFWYIDAYYLRLERALRNREQKYINFMNSLDGLGVDSTEERQNMGRYGRQKAEREFDICDVVKTYHKITSKVMV